MDKIEQLFGLFESNNLTGGITIDRFKQATEDERAQLFDLLKQNKLDGGVDYNLFSSAWGEKKNLVPSTSQEVVTESTTTTETQDGSSDSLGENNTITQAKESVRLFDEETKRLLEANEGATEDELQAIFNREGAPPEEVYSLINIDEQSNQEKVDANERVERLDSIGYIENNLESFDTKGVSEFDKKRLSAKEKSYNIKNPDTGAFELKKESEIDDNLLEDINIYDKATSESRFNIIDNSIVNKNRESIESVPVDIEDSVFLDTDINKSDYAKWEAENIRKGNSAYKFFKNILKSEDEEEFFKQERQVEKLQAYEVSNLNDIRKDLERIDALRKIKSDEAALKDLNNQERVLATKFQKTLETMSKIPDSFELYKKEKLDNELSRRKKIYNASREGVLSESAVELENITKAAGSALISFSTEFFAGIPGFFDHRFTQAGFDEKGILAGLSEMISDPGKAVETSYGAVSRSGFQQGKPVTYKGDEYIVNDNGTVFDKKTNVSVDGIIPESEIQKIKQRSTDVTNEVINWNGGATVQGLTSTLVNLVGLIKAGGKTKNVLNLKGKNAGKIGMGLASFTSSVMGNVDDVRSELMASGMNENEAVDVAITAGSAIATLDGIFSSLAGDNAKLLSGFQAIKDQIKNLAIKEGKSITKKQLIDKGKELVKENVKEFTIEELPVYFSEKGINYLVNQSVGKDVLDDKIRKSEILETAVMTIGATTLTGSRKLLTGNSRSDLVRTVARNVDNLQETVDNLVNEGLITKDQGLSTYNEIYNMQQAELKTKGTVIMSDNMEEASDLLSQRDKLVEQGRDLQGPLREDIDKRISDVDEQLRSLKERDLKQAKEEIKKTTIDEKVEEVTPVEETTVNITPETSSNYANMTEDSDDNFVFFHSGKKGYETVKPMSGDSKATSREEAAALSKVGGMAMYYTSDRDTERQGADDAKYVVKIPKGKVYDFNNDTNNYLEEAERRHKEENPGKAFDRNTQLAYVTKIAGENGFDMVVSEWAGKTRAQTTKELKPVDVKEKDGARITKQFSEAYVDNKEKGFVSVVPTTMSEMLSGVYDKIYKERNKTNTYDDLYFLAEKNADYTQDEITKLVNESDISQELKDEYNAVVKTIIEPRRSKKVNIKDKYTSNEIDKLKSLPTESESGATMNLDGSKYENGGLVLPVASANMKVSDLTVEAVDNLIKENSESIGADNVKVGIYKFPNSDNASIDINIVADRSMRSEALKIGKELGQESLFDLDTFENVKTGADGKNPKKLSPKEFLEIQERLKPKEDTKTTTEAQKIKEIMSVDVSSQVEDAKKALSSIAPDVEIILHESEQAYAEATGETGRKQKTAGSYNETVVDGEKKKVIHINPEKANERTVAHEVFHAIFLNSIKNDAEAQRLSAAMIKAVYKTAPAELKRIIDDFATSKNADGSNNYDLDVQNEEKLAELIGYLASEYDSLPKPTKGIIKRFLDRLAKMFGMKPFTDNEVVDVLNTIAKKVSTGEAITSDDVSIISSVDQGVLFQNAYLGTPGKVVQTKTNRKSISSTNISESDVIDTADLAGKPLEVVYYDNFTSEKYVLRNRVSGSTMTKNGEGGPGYSYRKNIRNKGIIGAFTTVTKGLNLIQGIRSRNSIAKENAVVGVALQNKDTGHLGNKTTLRDFYHPQEGVISKAVQDGVISNKNAVDILKSAVDSYGSLAVGIKNPLGFDSESFNSIEEFYNLMNNLSFELRGTFNSATIPSKTNLKITKATKPYVKNWLDSGVPTLSEYNEATAEPYTKNAKSHDIVKYLSPKLSVIGVDSSVEVSDVETDRAEKMGVKIVKIDDNVSHTSYPVVLFGKNVGIPKSFHSLRDMAPEWNVPNPFFKAGRRKDKANPVRIPKELKSDREPEVSKPTTRSSKQQVRIEDIIDKLKSNGISDAGVIKYLEEQGFKNGAKEVAKYNKANDISIDLFRELPPAFKSTENGLNLAKRVVAHTEKLASRLGIDEAINKGIEFLQSQPEYKKLVKEDNDYILSDALVREFEAMMEKKVKRSPFAEKILGMRAEDKKIRADIRRTLKLRGKGANDLQRLKVQVRNFVKKNIPRGDYTKGEISRILSIVTNVKDINSLDKAMDQVTEFVAEKKSKSLKDYIDKVLSKKYSATKSGVLVAKTIGAEAKKAIDYINSNKSIDDAYELIDSIESKDTLTDEDYNQILAAQASIQLLSYDVNDENGLSNLEELKNNLDAIIAEGRSELKAQLRTQHEMYVRNKKDAFKDITGEDYDSMTKEERNKLRFSAEQKKKRDGVIKKAYIKVAESINGFFVKQEAVRGLIDIISKSTGEMFGGKLQEMITDKINDSSFVYKENMIAMKQMLQDKTKEIYGKNYIKSLRNNRKNVDTGYKLSDGNNLFMSQDEAAYLYNQYKDETNHSNFESKFVGEDVADMMRFLENQFISKESKEFSDWMVEELFPSLYGKYNDVYKRMNRIDMPWNSKYGGKLYNVSEKNIEVTDILTGSNNSRASLTNGSQKERVDNNNKIVVMNQMDALFTYLKDMEFYVAYAENLRDIQKIFNDKEIGDAIERTSSKEVLSSLRKKIDNVVNRGSTANQSTARLVNSMTDVFVTSRLGLNPVVGIKQLTSSIAYSSEIGIEKWLSEIPGGVMNFKSTWDEIVTNSPYIRDRYAKSINKTFEVYSEESLSKFIPKSSANKGIDALMWFIKVGDKGGIMGGIPNYIYHKKQFKKKNPNATEQQAIDYAVRKFQNVTKDTQQSNDIQDRDLLQDNPNIRFLQLFQTSQKQYLRKEFSAIRQIARKARGMDSKGSLRSNIETFLMFHTVLPMFFQYIALGLPGILSEWDDDDDDTLARAALVGNLNAIFIFGDAIDAVWDSVEKKPWAGNAASLPVLQSVSAIAKNGVKWSNSTKPETIEKWRDKTLLEAASLTGLPAANISKVYRNLDALINKNETARKKALRFLQFSDYVIEGDKKSSAKKRTTKKRSGSIFGKSVFDKKRSGSIFGKSVFDKKKK